MQLRIRTVFIVEIYDLESALIHVEVKLLKIRSHSSPEHSIRILCFNGFPSRKTNPLAVMFWRYITIKFITPALIMPRSSDLFFTAEDSVYLHFKAAPPLAPDEHFAGNLQFHPYTPSS